MFVISPESTFKFVKFCVTFTSAWPPKKNASKRDAIMFEMQWWILWFNTLFISVLSVYTSYVYRRNIYMLIECLIFVQLFIQISVKMIICKAKCKRIQSFLGTMESYFHDASLENKEIFIDYVKKYGTANAAFIFYVFLSSFEHTVEPLFSSRTLPMKMAYPFNMDSKVVLQLLYMENILTGFQLVSAVGIDNQISMMIWCIVVRFEIFRKDISKITNVEDFKMSIQNHQYLLWLARETVNISRYIVFTTLISSVVTVILCGGIIVGKQSFLVRMTSIRVLFARCILLLLHALPSEYLLQSCEGVSSAIYECKWVDSNIRKDIAFVIFRSHKPIIVSIPGFLPKLSLNYYAMFLSKSFSFFTTLRIVLSKINLGTAE